MNKKLTRILTFQVGVMTKSKRSQAWIETVVYTLIMLSIIGIVLAVAKPAIQQKQDKVIIDQTISVLNVINSNVEEIIYYGLGNSRPVDVSIKKGNLKFNPINNTLEFELDSKAMYSQPGQALKSGGIIILTEKKANSYLVKLKLDYNGTADITFNNKNDIKTLTQSQVPYNLFIKYANYTGSLPQLDFSLS